MDLGRALINALAEIGKWVPSVPKPARKLDLYKRIFWTGIVLILYLVMANTPLPGVHPQTSPQVLLMNIIFAANTGTLMQLGIGPIVTAGLVLQLLVGAKLIDLDLSDPDDQKLFTFAQKGFAAILGFLEAAALVLSGSLWIRYIGGVPTVQFPSPLIVAIDVILLALSTLLVIIMDEMVQKGWGIGSGISLFIAASVVNGIFWELLGWFEQGGKIIWAGLVPAAMLVGIQNVIIGNKLNMLTVHVPTPDLIGLLATIAMVIVIAYLSSVKINVPIAMHKMRGLRTKIPLNLLYVTNIPVLLAGVIFANIQAISANIPAEAAQTSPIAAALKSLGYYLTPPRGLIDTFMEPIRALTFSIALIIFSIAFGLMWVELAGLDPKSQAEMLVKSGMQVPGMRSDPRILEKILAKYIYPLTILSSIIVALLVIVADVLGAYGTGTGLLLAVMILQQYYMMITAERALEAYPLLRRLVGE